MSLKLSTIKSQYDQTLTLVTIQYKGETILYKGVRASELNKEALANLYSQAEMFLYRLNDNRVPVTVLYQLEEMIQSLLTLATIEELEEDVITLEMLEENSDIKLNTINPKDIFDKTIKYHITGLKNIIQERTEILNCSKEKNELIQKVKEELEGIKPYQLLFYNMYTIEELRKILELCHR